MTSFLQDIPKRLKIVRIAAGYHSAKKFIDASGIPASTYSQHESGSRALTLENVGHGSKSTVFSEHWA